MGSKCTSQEGLILPGMCNETSQVQPRDCWEIFNILHETFGVAHSRTIQPALGVRAIPARPGNNCTTYKCSNTLGRSNILYSFLSLLPLTWHSPGGEGMKYSSWFIFFLQWCPSFPGHNVPLRISNFLQEFLWDHSQTSSSSCLNSIFDQFLLLYCLYIVFLWTWSTSADNAHICRFSWLFPPYQNFW